MFLKKFIIRNFRAIKYLELDFNKGLNIIIGENNAAKTTVIDALRLCLGDFQQPKDIYCLKTDFRIEKSKITDKIEDIQFDLIFECENDNEKITFHELHAIDKNKNESLKLHFRFELVDNKLGQRIKRKVWGGEYEGKTVSNEIRSILRNVYLSALRDTDRNLKPVKGNVIGNLYSNISHTNDKDVLLNQVTKQLEEKSWQNFIEIGKKNILDHLKELSYLTEEKRQDVNIGFVPLDFDELVQKLMIQIPIYSQKIIDENHDQKYFEISQNGLGYNNLIYTAAVLGDIHQRKELSEEEYTLLLIEEPEAHLHPQLQNTFFNYLEKLNGKNEYQIIVTSHSPTITAKTDLKLLTILQNFDNEISSTQIKDVNLEAENLSYLQKFLDVTKSQLFFANGVILVEGISETLLLPIFSKILGENNNYSIENNGIEVVNVNGVSFKHFAKLFNSNTGKERLKSRCSLVTDDDRDTKNPEHRIKKIRELENGNLKAFIGNKTFEYELFINNPNNESLKNVIKKVFKRSYEQILDHDLEKEDKADLLVQKLSKRPLKSEFSYLLSMELEEDNNYLKFKVPEYIENAIKFVIERNN